MVRPGQRQAHTAVGGAWQPYSNGFDEQGVVNEGEEVTTNNKTQGVNPEVDEICWCKRKRTTDRLSINIAGQRIFWKRNRQQRQNTAKSDKKAFQKEFAENCETNDLVPTMGEGESSRELVLMWIRERRNTSLWKIFFYDFFWKCVGKQRFGRKLKL